MNKKCTIVIVFLLLVIGGGIYKFIFQGSVSESTDGRLAVHLNAGETDLVLMEMRMFLEAVQQIVKGFEKFLITLFIIISRQSNRLQIIEQP